MTDASGELPIGGNVRHYRKARGKSQAVIAGLAGIETDYLAQIERGHRTPTIKVLHRIARALEVPTSALLGEPEPVRDAAGHPAIDAVYRAMTVPMPTPADSFLSLDALRARVEQAWMLWQGSKTRYTDVVVVLPELIEDVEAATARCGAPGEADERREAAQIAADLYFLVRTFCKRAGRVDLSLLAADRSLRFARDGEDALRVAAAHWNMGHALLADGAPEHALAVALAASEEIDIVARRDGDDEAVALYGALQLVAVTAASRVPGQAWSARDRLRDHALPASRCSGGGNVLWTAFSELNVNLHAFNLELEDGQLAEALRIADQLDPSSSPSIERRLTFLLDLARASDQRRDDAAVLLYLLEAEREAPEDLRYNVLARDLVRSLAKRARPTMAPQIGGLASRIGLIEV